MITPPKDPTLQCVIHLDEMDALKPDELKAIENTISGARLAEEQFNPQAAQRLLTKIANSLDPQAAPSIRAFEKFGAKGLPAIDAAIAREPLGTLSYIRLAKVRDEMAAPTSLIGMVGPEPAVAEERGFGR